MKHTYFRGQPIHSIVPRPTIMGPYPGVRRAERTLAVLGVIFVVVAIVLPFVHV